MLFSVKNHHLMNFSVHVSLQPDLQGSQTFLQPFVQSSPMSLSNVFLGIFFIRIVLKGCTTREGGRWLEQLTSIEDVRGHVSRVVWQGSHRSKFEDTFELASYSWSSSKLKTGIFSINSIQISSIDFIPIPKINRNWCSCWYCVAIDS